VGPRPQIIEVTPRVKARLMTARRASLAIPVPYTLQEKINPISKRLVLRHFKAEDAVALQIVVGFGRDVPALTSALNSFPASTCFHSQSNR
jgi:hypothetical protein